MKTLTEKEKKAVSMVRNGQVLNLSVRVPVDGEFKPLVALVDADVSGSKGVLYHVTIDPEGKSCTCPHGEHHSPAASCSHVIATELAVAYRGGKQ